MLVRLVSIQLHIRSPDLISSNQPSTTLHAHYSIPLILSHSSLTGAALLLLFLFLVLVLQLCKKKFQLITDSGLDASETETTSTAAAAVAEVVVKKGKQTKKQVEQQQQEAAAAETAKQQEMEDREVSATEMRAEVATLIGEIFKGLSSPVISLRPVALSALLCITRAAVSTANTDPDCRTTIASSLRAALVEFASKKNSRLAPKIFEELVSRYPEFCVLSFLPDLISSCESAKSAFLRAECCRFLTCILKRHKSLQGKALEVMDASLKNMVRTLGRALCSNCSSSASLGLLEDAEKGDKADKNKKNKKSKKEAAAADATAVTEIDSSSNSATEGKGKEKEKETRAKRLKPLLLCTKELAHLLKLGVAGEVPGKAGGVNSQALAALLAVMRSEGLTDSSNNPAIVRMVDQVVTLINSTGASSSGSSSSSSGSAVEVTSATKDKAAAGVPAAAAVVKVSKKEKKQKKEKDDGMVMGEGEAEEEDVYDDDALPIGEYVEAGAAGPKFKKKKGSKVVEAKEDKQETLDIAEKQVLKRMHADKRYRDEVEDVQTREDVGQKKKWHE